jgi:hypothetical protein
MVNSNNQGQQVNQRIVLNKVKRRLPYYERKKYNEQRVSKINKFVTDFDV